MLTLDRALGVLLADWSAQGRRRIVQTAVAGRWEDARPADVPADVDDARALVGAAGSPGDDLAAEFEWLGAPLVFVGARRGEGRDEGRAFAQAVVDVAAVAIPDTPAVALATLAGGPPREATHIELGAANAWQSVGPLRLWDAGDNEARPGAARRLGEHAALARCHRPVALEVAFAQPRECWVGIEVSDPSGDEHVVDGARVDALVARLLDAGR